MGKVFLRGVLGIAPLAITIFLILWLFKKLEGLFGDPLKEILGAYYFTGLGVIVAVVVLFFVGLIFNNWLVQKFYRWIEKQLRKIPLLKTIYTSVTDLMSFFRAGNKKEKDKMVIVAFAEFRMVGLITREDFDDLPNGIGTEQDIAVFFPFSYQIGGVTMIVPRSSVKPLDLSVERGLRFAITAGSPSKEGR